MSEYEVSRIEYKKQLMQGAHNCKSVCEELRMIYDIVHVMEDSEQKNELTERLVDAFIMVKKMHNRLVYYRDKYGDLSEGARTKLQHIPDASQRIRMRRKRVVE